MDTNERLQELENRKEPLRVALTNLAQIRLNNAAKEMEAMAAVDEARKDLLRLADELGVSGSSLNLN